MAQQRTVTAERLAAGTTSCEFWPGIAPGRPEPSCATREPVPRARLGIGFALRNATDLPQTWRLHAPLACAPESGVAPHESCGRTSWPVEMPIRGFSCRGPSPRVDALSSSQANLSLAVRRRWVTVIEGIAAPDESLSTYVADSHPSDSASDGKRRAIAQRNPNSATPSQRGARLLPPGGGCDPNSTETRTTPSAGARRVGVGQTILAANQQATSIRQRSCAPSDPPGRSGVDERRG